MPEATVTHEVTLVVQPQDGTRDYLSRPDGEKGSVQGVQRRRANKEQRRCTIQKKNRARLPRSVRIGKDIDLVILFEPALTDG
mmetsp:Transcript_13603/g.26992  ORF Transcript_13603/g.26992 Transcript_13603/m.26992 type:complete len:83 (-) Transcript_13603:3432-3680(-)